MTYNAEEFQKQADSGELSGIVFDVPEDVYRSSPGVCQSDLKEMRISPAHYHHRITAQKEPPTPAQITGTLTHSLILCGRKDFVVLPDDAPKRPTKAQYEAKKPSEETIKAMYWWRNFLGLDAGKEILSKEDADHLEAMKASVYRHPVAREILERNGRNEVACWKRHEPTGLLLRGRADRVTTDNQGYTCIPDLKTVPYGGAKESEFTRDIFKWGYHFQGAFYKDLFEASYFVFIVVEKEPPYAVACYNLSPEAVNYGRREYQAALEQVSTCAASNEWPSYSTGLNPITLPEWVLRKEM